MSIKLWALLGLAFTGCNECRREAIQTSVRVYVPRAALVPRHCLSDHDASCREADEVVGLAHTFYFEQHAEGRVWCSYVPPPGRIRTSSCDDTPVTFATTRSEARELIAVVHGCEVSEHQPELGAACSVLTQLQGLPRDSCGDGHFCRAADSTCQLLPEACRSDADCTFVSVCDETELCVRYVCDEGRECVYPDECLDTSDCHRSHSRCREGRECDTFTCETGRCVGASRD